MEVWGKTTTDCKFHFLPGQRRGHALHWHNNPRCCLNCRLDPMSAMDVTKMLWDLCTTEREKKIHRFWGAHFMTPFRRPDG